MARSLSRGLGFCTLAALLWSPHVAAFQSLRAGGGSALALMFHGLLWAALGCLLLLFLSGRAGELRMFSRQQTLVLVLGGLGGYGFWLFLALGLGAGQGAAPIVWLYSAPLLMALFSAFTSERADASTVFGLVLGFVGCILVARGSASGGGEAAGDGGSAWAALAAAGCWAVFTIAARPIAQEGRALPATALVTGVGAACMLVTCLSTGEGVLAVRLSQMSSIVLWGVFTIGLMMAAWLRGIVSVPAPRAAAVWYVGAVFGAVWALAGGRVTSLWWPFGGAILVGMGLYLARPARERRRVTFGDILRG